MTWWGGRLRYGWMKGGRSRGSPRWKPAANQPTQPLVCMTSQPNTPAHERSQHTAAKRRLLRKVAFALPIIVACGALPALGSPEGHQDLATAQIAAPPSDPPKKRRTELEREVIVILNEYQREWEN